MLILFTLGYVRYNAIYLEYPLVPVYKGVCGVHFAQVNL